MNHPIHHQGNTQTILYYCTYIVALFMRNIIETIEIGLDGRQPVPRPKVYV